MTIKVMGHKNPDADSILSSIALADLLTKIGKPAKPYSQGKINNDTIWALDKFNFKRPELVETVANQQIAIVDTTSREHLPADIKKAEVVFIVDHHNLDNLKTKYPIDIWIRPVGCCGTIIQEIYEYHNLEIPKEIAGILCAAILNDTVMFKSPTTTNHDKKAVEKLAPIAKIEDINKFAIEMFEVKSNIDDTPHDLIKRDFKNTTVGTDMFGIGQLELININNLTDKKVQEILAEMKVIKERDGYETIILMLTDIMMEGSKLLAISNNMFLMEKTFNGKFKNNISDWIPGLMSRKKQIIPPILKNLY